MKKFLEYIADEAAEEIGYLVVVLPKEDLCLPHLKRLEEGKWTQAGHKDFMIRIDPVRPETKEQRHIHIARKKHMAAKEKQVAWNQDGSRHDKNSFNTALGKQNAVRDIAAKALNIPESLLEVVKIDSQTTVGLLLEDENNRPASTWTITIRLHPPLDS